MRLYFKAFKLNIRSFMQYKASFILSFISQLITVFSYYFIIIALFTKFDNIKGFTLYEVLLCFGIIQFGFSFNELFARGLDQFDRLIIDGGFDRLLLRPKNIIIQVLSTDSDLTKSARLLESFVIIIISLIKLNLSWTFLKALTLILMLISSCIIFFGIFLISASYCFFTIQGLEFRNLLADGGKHIAQYPIGIFKKVILYFFTFIIPYGFVNYYPLLYLLGRKDNMLYAFSPLVVLIYLVPCFCLFYKACKRYASTGS